MAILSQKDVDLKEIAAWDRRFNQCATGRSSFEQQWYTNLSMYFGRQWAVWRRTPTGGSRLIDPPIPRNRVRLVTNMCRPIVRRELTKLTKQEPIFYVVPNTTEASDIAAAHVAESITEYCLDTAEFKKIRRSATLWTCLTGTGYIKVTCLERDADITYEAPSTWHVFVPDLQIEDIQEQQFVIHARAFDCDVIEQAYGVRVQPDVQTGGGALEQKFFSALGIKQDNATAKDQCYVKEVWVKPGRMSEYPDGAMMVIGGGQMLYKYEYKDSEEDNQLELPLDQLINPLITPPAIKPSNYPYTHVQYPFIKFDHIPSGQYYASSVLEDINPLQRELNKTRSQMIEIKNRTAKPNLFYHMGAIDPALMTSEPGLMVPVRPGNEFPKYDTPPELPQYFPQEIDRIHQDMDYISNQFETAQGRTPPGVEAASAIAFLQEQNDTTLYHTVASIEDGLCNIGKQSLSLVQQHWSKEKVTGVVSKNNATDTQFFKTSNINGNTDLKIEAGSIAPQSRAARQAFLLGLIDRGLPLEKALGYLDMSETKRMYQESQIDTDQARRENLKMSTEIDNLAALPVNMWDNHSAHLYEHGMYMKSNEFETLDPKLQAVMTQHYLMHLQAMNPQLGAQNPNDLQSQSPAEPGNPSVEPSTNGEYAGASSGGIQ